MNARKTIRFLRISYWVGAIVDAIVIVPMVSSSVGGVMLGITDCDPGPDYRYAIGIGSSLMCGWVMLLLWVDRKPVERKGVLLFTIIPVLVGLMVSGIYAVHSNLVIACNMLPTWIVQGLLVFLFGFSYLKAGTL